MPLPAALQARLQRRGIKVQNEEAATETEPDFNIEDVSQPPLNKTTNTPHCPRAGLKFPTLQRMPSIIGTFTQIRCRGDTPRIRVPRSRTPRVGKRKKLPPTQTTTVTKRNRSTMSGKRGNRSNQTLKSRQVDIRV